MDTPLLIALILLIVICEACAQSSANMLKHSGNIWYLLIGGLFYTLVIYFLSESHKYASMGIINSIWSGLSIVSIATVGYVCFGQKLSAHQIGMMGVILIGVGYLSTSFEPEPG